MSTVNKKITTIPIFNVPGIDERFGRLMKMDIENIPKKFMKVYAKTRSDSFSVAAISAIYESYEIDRISDGSIRLCNGEILESSVLSEVFGKSGEIVFHVISVSGYEDLDEAAEDMMERFFLDNWWTAIVECGSAYLIQDIKKDLEIQGLYSTGSFSPGQQHSVLIEFQKIIFSLLKPDEIGVALNDHFLMYPKKSISGMFGIGTERIKKELSPCDFCERKETCSSSRYYNMKAI